MRKQNRGDIFKKYAGDIFGKTWKAVQVGEWGRGEIGLKDLAWVTAET